MHVFWICRQQKQNRKICHFQAQVSTDMLWALAFSSLWAFFRHHPSPISSECWTQSSHSRINRKAIETQLHLLLLFRRFGVRVPISWAMRPLWVTDAKTRTFCNKFCIQIGMPEHVPCHPTGLYKSVRTRVAGKIPHPAHFHGMSAGKCNSYAFVGVLWRLCFQMRRNHICASCFFHVSVRVWRAPLCEKI